MPIHTVLFLPSEAWQRIPQIAYLPNGLHEIRQALKVIGQGMRQFTAQTHELAGKYKIFYGLPHQTVHRSLERGRSRYTLNMAAINLTGLPNFWAHCHRTKWQATMPTVPTMPKGLAMILIGRQSGKQFLSGNYLTAC